MDPLHLAPIDARFRHQDCFVRPSTTNVDFVPRIQNRAVFEAQRWRDWFAWLLHMRAGKEEKLGGHSRRYVVRQGLQEGRCL